MILRVCICLITGALLAGCLEAAPNLVEQSDNPSIVTLPTTTPTVPPTLAPSPTVAIPPTITLTPTLEPVETFGPFTYITNTEALGGTFLTRLEADALGNVYALIERRAFRLVEGEWQPIVQNAPANILTVGPQGRLWAADEQAAYVYDVDRWVTLGPEVGWLPAPPVDETNAVQEILFASNGWVWMGTRVDVRVWDGQEWQSFGYDTLRMPEPAPGFYSDFSLMEARDGDIWVGECTFEAGSPTPDGGGARRYDGERWLGASSPAARGCVTAVAQGPDDWIWLDVGPVFWQYSPITEEWFNRALPLLPEGFRAYGEITDLQFDANAHPWPELTLCDEDSCAAGLIRYHFDRNSGLWEPLILDYEERPLIFSETGLLFLPFGVFPFEVTPATQQALPYFELTGEYTLPYAPLVDLSTFSYARSPDNTLWILGSAETERGRQVGLWRLQLVPPQPDVTPTP